MAYRRFLEGWTREKVIAEIKTLYKNKGFINISTIRKDSEPLYKAMKLFFKDRNEAFKLAGVKPLERSAWDKEKIILQIREIKKRKEPLNPAYIREKYPQLYYAAYSRLGGWLKARKLDFPE